MTRASTLLLALAVAASPARAGDGTTTTATAAPMPPPAAAPSRGTDPKAISTPPPEFPTGVKDPRHARVVLQMKVLHDGAIADLQVYRSGGEPAYDEAALGAARAWKFSPARDAAGAPVEAVIRVPLTFVPPATSADLAAGLRDILEQPCSRVTADIAAWRQQHPAAKLEDMPTFASSTGMIMATAFGRPPGEMVPLIKYWNAALPGIYARVADDCAARPDAVYEDVWAAAIKDAPRPPH